MSAIRARWFCRSVSVSSVRCWWWDFMCAARAVVGFCLLVVSWSLISAARVGRGGGS